jgi:hypothetical protein
MMDWQRPWQYPGCMANVTQILNAIEQGDTEAAEDLLPLVYPAVDQTENEGEKPQLIH